MEIRDYKSGDETHILKLFESSFGKPLSLEYWTWRFLKNPANKVMIKLMWEEDKLVGHYAVSPLKLIVEGKSILSALSMTTMTHPDYAGKGIFTKLAEALYDDEFQKNNLSSVWGFPNNNSHHGFINKLKWIDLVQIPVRELSIEKIIDKSNSNVNVVPAFSSKHIHTYKLLMANRKLSVDKSLEFLTWRYTENPSNKYDIFELEQDGYNYFAVTKVFSSFSQKDKYEIDILELNFPANENALNMLLSAIKKHYQKFDLLKVNLWLSKEDEKSELLNNIGFLDALPNTYLGIRILDKQYRLLEEPKEWFYSMVDSDIY